MIYILHITLVGIFFFCFPCHQRCVRCCWGRTVRSTRGFTSPSRASYIFIRRSWMRAHVSTRPFAFGSTSSTGPTAKRYIHTQSTRTHPLTGIYRRPMLAADRAVASPLPSTESRPPSPFIKCRRQEAKTETEPVKKRVWITGRDEFSSAILCRSASSSFIPFNSSGICHPNFSAGFVGITN